MFKELVIAVYANTAIFQLHHEKKNLNFNEMIMRSVLY